jgi:toxin ParE1/3/4
VKPYHVLIRPLAQADLLEIHSWLKDVAGLDIAEAYLDRLQVHLTTLENHPQRGTPRPKAGIGVRSITFERRLVVGYRVMDHEVWVERVVSGARNLEWLS